MQKMLVLAKQVVNGILILGIIVLMMAMHHGILHEQPFVNKDAFAAMSGLTALFVTLLGIGLYELAWMFIRDVGTAAGYGWRFMVWANRAMRPAAARRARQSALKTMEE